MSISVDFAPTTIIEMPDYLSLTRETQEKILLTEALRRSIQPPTPDETITLDQSPKIPDELRERIKLVKDMPGDLLDQRLRLLVDSTIRTDDMRDSGELPKILVEEIQETADTILHEWTAEDFNVQSIMGLCLAADDTHNPDLLVQTLKIARLGAGLDGHLVIKALERAIDNQAPFRGALQEITAQQRAIETPVRIGPPKKAYGPTFDANDVPMEEYEWLFDPSGARYPAMSD